MKKPGKISHKTKAVDRTGPPSVATEDSKPLGADGGNPNFADNADDIDQQEKTLYLKLDKDGNPLWSRMTPRTIENWEAIFKHPSTGAQFSTQALPPEDAGAKPADAEMLLGWLAVGQAMLFARLTALPLAAAAEICTYAAEEKAALSPRLARLLNKHGGDWMAKYGDEIFFASALGMGMAHRFQSCREEVARRKGVAPAPTAPGEGPEKKVEEGPLVN